MTTNYFEMNAAQIKAAAKDLKVKNWWTLPKEELRNQIAITLGWDGKEESIRNYLLQGKEIHVCPDAEIPAPRPAREDCAGAKTTPKEENVNTTKRKPRKVAKKTADKPETKTKAKAAKKTELPEGWVTLATLCEENDIKPTVARRRLRTAEAEKHEQYGWAWKRPAAVIVKIIKGENRTFGGLTETPAPRKIKAIVEGEK